MSHKKKTILISIVTLLLAILFIFFLILPTLKEIKKISQKISETKTNLKEIEKRTEILSNFKKKFPEIKENLSIFENSMVEKDFPVNFISFLESTAKDCQIFSEISLSPKGKDFLSFQIKAVGFPQNIFRFLEKVENSPYLVQSEKIIISKISESEVKEKKEIPAGSLKLDFSLRVQAK